MHYTRTGYTDEVNPLQRLYRLYIIRGIRHPKTFDVTLQRYDTVTPSPFDESCYYYVLYDACVEWRLFSTHILD